MHESSQGGKIALTRLQQRKTSFDQLTFLIDLICPQFQNNFWKQLGPFCGLFGEAKSRKITFGLQSNYTKLNWPQPVEKRRPAQFSFQIFWLLTVRLLTHTLSDAQIQPKLFADPFLVLWKWRSNYWREKGFISSDFVKVVANTNRYLRRCWCLRASKYLNSFHQNADLVYSKKW